MAEPLEHYLLKAWLLEQGHAEEERGYGHVSAEDLATDLLAQFDIFWPENLMPCPACGGYGIQGGKGSYYDTPERGKPCGVCDGRKCVKVQPEAK
jgi:hypothetical protein